MRIPFVVRKTVAVVGFFSGFGIFLVALAGCLLLGGWMLGLVMGMVIRGLVTAAGGL